MDENVKERAKRIEIKIFLWRKYNLSTIGDLSVSKTFVISQLGYILSMLDCPKEILETMHLSIDNFVTRAKHSWISKKRIYNKPKNRGVGAICKSESICIITENGLVEEGKGMTLVRHNDCQG